jgi:hypothetical protein
MKNIHLISTEKPSSLYIGDNGSFVFGMIKTSTQSRNDDFTNQHIYITSDEQPKHNDYYTIDGKEIYYCNILNPTRNNHYKKVILTTDPDLISDGVQAIDDEFLEWFVKNPNYEWVSIESYKIDKEWDEKHTQFNPVYPMKTKYKIIIPQEEPKQETLTYTEAAKKEERIFNSTMMSKQETLEEAAKKYAEEENSCYTNDYYGFINGAKWQAERSYSEEEAKKLIVDFLFARGIGREVENVNKWFEQFKKK